MGDPGSCSATPGSARPSRRTAAMSDRSPKRRTAASSSSTCSAPSLAGSRMPVCRAIRPSVHCIACLAEAGWKPSRRPSRASRSMPRSMPSGCVTSGEAQVAEGEQPIVVQARAVREPEVIEVAAALVTDAVAQRLGHLCSRAGRRARPRKRRTTRRGRARGGRSGAGDCGAGGGTPGRSAAPRRIPRTRPRRSGPAGRRLA